MGTKAEQLMKIVMFTNTFSPNVGGVAHSVSGLAEGLRERDHRVPVVAPMFSDAPDIENDVIRVPALQELAGSDFSVPIPASKSLVGDLSDFQPDLIHSHHPFLLGGTAPRVSAARDLPVIYTHHTRYDLYDHYIKQNSALMKRLVLSLTIGYGDLCNVVITTSQSAAELLAGHKVSAPTVAIPTGVKIDQFEHGNKVIEISRSSVLSKIIAIISLGIFLALARNPNRRPGGRENRGVLARVNLGACSLMAGAALVLSSCDQYGNFDLGSENAAAVFNSGANVVLTLGGAGPAIPLYD